ncbi:hypothetical protein MOLA814_01417 [Betaproteobacteria bacterium MOLA814]|nr:hypothetical protein MOLA814_01417 [Betaproteobacteria bacterium MOLA814]
MTRWSEENALQGRLSLASQCEKEPPEVAPVTPGPQRPVG